MQHDGAKPLTFDPAYDATPVWSPDASWLVFSSNRQFSFDLYMKNTDGAQEEKSIVPDDPNKYPTDWSKDEKHILYTRGEDLWLVTVPELKSSLFLKAVSVLRNSQFSPGGKWVAYASNETGKWEIYVTSFPEARGRWAGLDGRRRAAPVAGRRQRALLSIFGREDHGRVRDSRC